MNMNMGSNLAKIEKIEEFDVIEVQEVALSKAKNNEVMISELTSKLDLGNMNTVVTFGKEAVDEIAKLSDTILRSTEMDKVSDAGVMLESLGRIMDKFDPKELADSEKKGILSKLFNNVQKQLDGILKKYNTMGDEVDKIYIQLKEYENEIYSSNDKLEQLFDSNLEYYQLLTNYILAGEEGINLIDNHKKKLEIELTETSDNTIQFQIQNVEQGRIMLEQRVQDLRMAESVAMQSLPMLKAMQFSNMNLVRKINSAFIITLPVFKSSLAQAVLLKRQKIQADALSALDERTNEMLIKNAQNTVDQTKLIAQLSSGSSIKVETLEQTWKIIVDGVEETKRIQDEAVIKREEDRLKLLSINNNFSQKVLNENRGLNA